MMSMYFVIWHGLSYPQDTLDQGVEFYQLDEKERLEMFVEMQEAKGCVCFVYEGRRIERGEL